MSDERETQETQAPAADEPVKVQRARIPEAEPFDGDPYGADIPPLLSSRINAARVRRAIT